MENISLSTPIETLSSPKKKRAALIAQLKAEGREREISEALKALKKETPKIPRDLCYVEGADRENYLYDMKQCQIFARYNRERIAAVVCKQMGWKAIDNFHTVHNYIDDEGMVRKGAIAAQAGRTVLIPMNMRDGCILGMGLGNKDWNCSAPHGAGRLMSRTKAKAEIPLEEYRETMTGVFTTSVCPETLDEAPQAYKPAAEILECISDTVKVIKIIKPVYNFKASE